jgi:hypothetical protein
MLEATAGLKGNIAPASNLRFSLATEKAREITMKK